MVTCPNCQFDNPEGVTICAGCGTVSAPGLLAPVVLVPTLSAPTADPLILTPAPVPALADGHRPAPSALTVNIRSRPPAGPPPSDQTPPPQGPVELTAAPPAPSAVTVPNRPPADAPPPPPAPPPLRPRLVVLRGQRVKVEYPIYEGRNTVGRFVDKPVDIDLLAQEADYQVWCSRLHAALTFDRGVVVIEDLNSLNGTWVNGARVTPGQQRVLQPNDVIQVGTVQMRLVVD